MARGATAIVLSYRRPQNIPRLVKTYLAARQVGDILISNNNPDVVLPALPQDSRIRIISQPVHTPAAVRHFLAAGLDAETFISIDDDVFLASDQVDQLVDFLWANPAMPHGGPWGQRLVTGPDGTQRLEGWYFPNLPVDVINRAYAFTRTHSRRFVEMAGRLGLADPLNFGPGEDVLLSHCGQGPPVAHDIGQWIMCETANTPGIAAWRRPDFKERRRDLLARIRALGVFPYPPDAP